MECPLTSCSEHGVVNNSDCKNCMSKQEISICLINLNKKLIQERKKKESENDKLKALISIAEEKLKQTSTDKIRLDENSAQTVGIPLSDHFSQLRIPNDFFSIVTKEEFAIAFMVQVNFLPASIFCQKCSAEMKIIYYESCGYIYSCYLCSSKNKIRNVTCFQNSPLNIEKILLFVFFWVLGIRDLEISNLLEVSHQYISSISRKVRQVVGEEFLKDPPKFSGVVEIDELDFIKRKIEIGKSKVAKKWILVMIERGTKQMYMEYIPDRNKKVIIPIIQKYCIPGTIIITKTWAGYGRLEDLGYCHYTYDKTKGFIDPQNNNIHHCNIKVAFTWLKYHIKTKNRAGFFLQEYILEWLWRKRGCSKASKDTTHIYLVKTVLSLLTKVNRII